MITITAILKADAEGTLHLKVPEEFRNRRLRVVATPVEEERALEPLTPEEEAALAKRLEELRDKAGLKRRELTPEEEDERRGEALEALKELRAANPYRDITDPVAWQKEIRKDRPLPFAENS